MRKRQVFVCQPPPVASLSPPHDGPSPLSWWYFSSRYSYFAVAVEALFTTCALSPPFTHKPIATTPRSDVVGPLLKRLR